MQQQSLKFDKHVETSLPVGAKTHWCARLDSFRFCTSCNIDLAWFQLNRRMMTQETTRVSSPV
jgi:hypothetical protein